MSYMTESSDFKRYAQDCNTGLLHIIAEEAVYTGRNPLSIAVAFID